MLTLAAIKENPQEIISRLKVKHFDGEALVKEILELDKTRRAAQTQFDRNGAELKKYAAQIMHTLYTNAPDGICGNDDCGQMSAWYVFSAMGFYPVDAIGGIYEIGTPLFPEVKLNLDNGKTFTVQANNVSRENIYIQSVKVNGKPYDKSYITHDMIMQGDTLQFEMGNQPGPVWYNN